MKRILITSIVFALAPALPAVAQTTSGPARAVDGDTLEIAGQRFRLQGIDAPELSQTCMRAGATWPCGKEAAERLEQLITGKSVTCEQEAIDAYGRVIGVCRVGPLDLGQLLIDAGMAVTLPNAQETYKESEVLRREHKVGIWAATFDLPSAYRAANPQQFPQAQRTNSSQQQRSNSNRNDSSAPRYRSTVLFRHCGEARAAGAAPIYRGQPGYRPEMDSDGDGIACEPYRGRR